MIDHNYKEISPQEVKSRLDQGDTMHIIDVREPDEWISGHIPGAQHIPLGFLELKQHELDPNKEYVMVCRSGNRSGLACQFLSQSGLKVMNMNGGMLDWTGKVVTGM